MKSCAPFPYLARLSGGRMLRQRGRDNALATPAPQHLFHVLHVESV